MKMDITKLLFCKLGGSREGCMVLHPPTLKKTDMSNVIKQEKTEEKEKRKKRVTYMIRP